MILFSSLGATRHSSFTRSTNYISITFKPRNLIGIRMLTGSLPFLFGTIILAVPAFSANATDWSTRSIYQVTRRGAQIDTRLTTGFQVITDRFATTNDSTLPCDTGARQYCGGSWSGITRHLDYIQSMGFDAVWISPVSANIEGVTPQGEAFHGCVVVPADYRESRRANSLSLPQVLDQGPLLPEPPFWYRR